MSCICQSVEFHIKSPRRTSPQVIIISPRHNSLCGLAYMCHIHFVGMVYVYNMCTIFIYAYWYMYDIFHYAEWYMSCICQSVEFHIKSPRKTSPQVIIISPRHNSLCGLADMCHIHFVGMVYVYNMCTIFVSAYWYMYDILYMQSGICHV